MKWTVGIKIGTGFALALAILVAIGATAYRSFGQLTDTADWVEHTHLVLQTIESVGAGLSNAETGQRGYVITGEEPYLEPYEAGRHAAAEAQRALRGLTQDNASQQERLARLEPLIGGKFAQMAKAIAARRDPAGGFPAAVAMVRTDQGKKMMDQIRRALDEMKDEETQLLNTRAAEAQASVRQAKSIIVFGTLGALVILGIAAMLITRNIARPLRQITATADRIAAGELAVALEQTDRQDEVGSLTRTFIRMADSLREMARVAGLIAEGDLRAKVEPHSERDILGTTFATMTVNLRKLTADLAEGINVLGSAASEISSSTSQLAASASQSATAVSETTVTVEEVRQTAELASQKAKNVAGSAQKAAEISQHGRRSADDAGAGMSRIRQQMDAIAACMVRLSEQSQAIGQIIATVEDLAAQSNLLAVNAAIEAAKAGEHGKGFGVVAQEVKSLAEQSRQATNQVRTILSEVQKATTTAALATEQGTDAVAAGSRQSETAGESIQALAASAAESAQAAIQIAASSQQQLVGVDQVAAAMESIKQTSVQNVASAKQLETAARSLSDFGKRLKGMIAHYQI